MLTAAQLTALKADILADPTLSAFPNNADGDAAIAALYNITASPDFWVWKSSVTQLSIVSDTSVDGTVWSWTLYIGRSQGERDAWREIFADTGAVSPALSQVRQGFADIFSGAGGAAQRTHLLAIARRKATRAEKLFATGTGSTGIPAVMAFEGSLTYQDVDQARNQ